MPRLILKKKNALVREFEFDQSKTAFIVGADEENDIVIEDNNICSKHLKVERINNSYYLQIINTTFPTQLNGRPLLRRVQIVDGDEVTIGDYTLQFANDRTPVSAPKLEEDIEIIGADEAGNVFDFDPTEPIQPPSNLNDRVAFETETSNQNDSTEILELPDLSESFLTEHPEENENGADTREGKDSNYCLLAIYGPYIGKRYPLKLGDTKIGRDNTLNDIIIRNTELGVLDPSVSRRHATISYRGGQFHVSDKRSKTRTYVNQTKLEPDDEVVAHEGDEIEIVSDQKSTIFRLAPKGASDFKPPRKAGFWWLRNSGRLFKLLAAASLVIAAGALAIYFNHKKAIEQKPEQLKLLEEPWYLAPTSEIDDSYDVANLAVADLDGKGQVDVVFTDAERHVTALDGMTKTKLWQSTGVQVQRSISIVLADLNANGLQDVLVVGFDARLRAYDGATGAEIWISPILGETVSGPPVVDDFNGDGLNDVAICSQAGDIHVGYSNIYDVNWKRIATQFSIAAPPSSMDWDDDGQKEIFVGTDSGKLLTVDAEGIVKVVNFDEKLYEAAGDVMEQPGFSKPMAFGDLNGDGIPELIAGSTTGDFLALQRAGELTFWHERLHQASQLQDWNFAPVTGRLNNDNLDDAVLFTNQLVRIIAGSSNPDSPKPVIWEYYVDGENYLAAPPALADLNKDGAEDVIVAAQDGTVSVFDGTDGKILDQISNEMNPVISPILVADVGGDGLSDLVFIRGNGNIYKIQTNSTLAENGVVWGQAYASAQHTNRFDYKPPDQSLFMVLAATFSILFVGFSGLIISGKKSRDKRIRQNQSA